MCAWHPQSIDPSTQWENLCAQLDEAINMPLNDKESLSEEQTPDTEVNGCGHSILPALQERLYHRTACPTCQINEHISDIRQIKSALERRGGIFRSKTHFSLNGDLRHKDYIKMWAVAKIHCYQDVRWLEGLRTDYPEQAQEWGVLDALEHWEQAQEEASCVPGYTYVQESIEEPEVRVEPVLAPVPAADGELDVEIGTSRPLTPEEMSELLDQDREYHFVTTKPNKKKRPLIILIESAAEDSLYTQLSEPATPDDDILQEMDDVTKRLDQLSTMGNRDLFDAITAVGACPPKDLQDNTLPLTLSIIPTDVKLSTIPPSHSALKGTRSIALTSRATFTNHTTTMTNTKDASIQEPHNKHTDAKLARSRGLFHRTSPWYREGTWAISGGFEKDDTSFMRMTWFRYEKYVRVPPAVKEKNAWVRSAEFGAKPKFNSRVTDAMDEMRDRKREDNGTANEKKDVTPASPVADVTDEVREWKQLGNEISTEKKFATPGSLVMGKWRENVRKFKMTSKPNLPGTIASKDEQDRKQENEAIAEDKSVTTGDDKKQMIVHPTMVNGHDAEEDIVYPNARMELTQLVTLPGGQFVLRSDPGLQQISETLRPDPSVLAVLGSSKPPASPKPVLRNLRRGKVNSGLTVGVGEVESER